MDLEISERFPDLTADELWAAWTTADGVTSFWAEEAEIAPEVGGRYVVRWPSMGWTMAGEVRAVDPGRSIALTWQWEQDDEPTRLVELSMQPDGDGSRLSITHGPFDDGDDESAREHEEGWRHFSAELRERGAGR